MGGLQFSLHVLTKRPVIEVEIAFDVGYTNHEHEPSIIWFYPFIVKIASQFFLKCYQKHAVSSTSKMNNCSKMMTVPPNSLCWYGLVFGFLKSDFHSPWLYHHNSQLGVLKGNRFLHVFVLDQLVSLSNHA